MDLIDRPMLDFLLHDWLNVDEVLQRPAFEAHSRESVGAMLDTASRLADSHYLPFYKAADQREPWCDADGAHVIEATRRAILAFAQAGFVGATLPPELGGLALPVLVDTAAHAYFSAANGPFAAYSTLSIGNAGVIAHVGTSAQRETFATPQLEGCWTGTMALSEPQAGSSLGDITTRAVPDGDDALGPRYRLFGAKMWISGGDHDAADNIVHLVLAKAPGADGKLPAGTRGISIFIVPKFLPDGEHNDVVLAGLNHKMGNRGTTNCLLNLGEATQFHPQDAAGAVGWRLGELGQGLPIMFRMMNEARIGVGLSAAMNGYRGYRLALEYARNRPQGRPFASSDPHGPQRPIIEHADVKRMLLACKAYSEGALALILYCARLVDDSRTLETADARAEAEALLGLLTPVAKTWPSEFALAANDLAIQIHGGYGYTRDFDVEQLYRDNRLNAIHEGATGIQAIDLLGRKIIRDGAKTFEIFAARVGEAIRGAPPGLAVEASTLDAALHALRRGLATLAAIDDETERMAHATAVLRAFGHVAVGFLWLGVAAIADTSPAGEGRRAACRFFHAYEAPRIAAWLAPIFKHDRCVIEMQDAWY